MELLNRIFSGSMDASRVNPGGLTVMLLAIVLVFLSGWISKKQSVLSVNAIKIIALVICAGGALLAILG
jgi:hypothetical protein